MWGYLTEFWGSITQVVLDAGTYTIAWFESVGNAVAGAIGGLFSDLIHHIYDLFYLWQWFMDGLKDLFSILMSPLVWAFSFGKGLIGSAFETAESLGLEIGEVAIFDANVFLVFDAIPYVNYIFAGVAGILAISFIVFIAKKLSTM